MIPQQSADTVTHHELIDELTRRSDLLLQKLGRNARFIRATETGIAGADPDDYLVLQFSPPNGFLWDIRMITTYAQQTGNWPAQVFLNGTEALNYIASTTYNNSYLLQFNKSLIIYPSDTLYVTNLNGGIYEFDNCKATLFIIEVPYSHEAQLLL